MSAISFLKISSDNLKCFYSYFADLEYSNIAHIINLLENIIENKEYKSDLSILKILYEDISNKYYIDKTKHIPYIGGYSDSCNIIYIDKIAFPQFNQKEVMSIVLHEFIEKNLLKHCKSIGYVFAHQISQQIEYCFYSNIEEKQFQNTIDEIENMIQKDFKKGAIIPLDLDKTPYSIFDEDILLGKLKKYYENEVEISFEYIDKKTDVEGIFNVEKAMFEQNKYYLSSMSFYKRVLSKKNHKLFVAKTNLGEIVGVSYFILSDKSVRFYSLAVLKGFQKYNIAKVLFDEIYSLAFKHKKDFLFLEIREDNKALMRNYTKSGFIHFKTLKNYYPDGVNGIRLYKRLTD